jgi:hypothetical protein
MSTQSNFAMILQRPEPLGAIALIMSIRISSITSHIRMAAAM